MTAWVFGFAVTTSAFVKFRAQKSPLGAGFLKATHVLLFAEIWLISLGFLQKKLIRCYLVATAFAAGFFSWPGLGSAFMRITSGSTDS